MSKYSSTNFKISSAKNDKIEKIDKFIITVGDFTTLLFF